MLRAFKDTSIVVHLDATGSVIRRIEGSQQKVFYYALTVQHPTYSTSPVPLAEMISSGHTSAEISYFLHKWSLDHKKTLGSVINIGQVEIDFSWALIHSVCNVFLKCDIDIYLDLCWNKLKYHSTAEDPDIKTIIHLCSAHLLHEIGFYINKKYKLKKDMKKLFLHSIGFMVRTTDFVLINIVFSALCMVFKSRYSSETVIENIKILESYICGTSLEFPDNTEIINEEDISYDNLGDVKTGKLMKDKSPFGKHFVQISQQCEFNINISKQRNTGEANPYYYPDLIGYLLTYYLPVLPLWSGVIFGLHRMSIGGNNYSHYSNAIAENWMRIIKIAILNSKCNLRPRDFIRNIQV